MGTPPPILLYRTLGHLLQKHYCKMSYESFKDRKISLSFYATAEELVNVIDSLKF